MGVDCRRAVSIAAPESRNRAAVHLIRCLAAERTMSHTAQAVIAPVTIEAKVELEIPCHSGTRGSCFYSGLLTPETLPKADPESDQLPK